MLGRSWQVSGGCNLGKRQHGDIIGQSADIVVQQLAGSATITTWLSALLTPSPSRPPVTLVDAASGMFIATMSGGPVAARRTGRRQGMCHGDPALPCAIDLRVAAQVHRRGACTRTGSAAWIVASFPPGRCCRNNPAASDA